MHRKRVLTPPRFKFPYVHRDPRWLIERFGLEVEALKPKRPAKKITGSEKLLESFRWLEGVKSDVEFGNGFIKAFLDERPQLKAEFDRFLVAGGGSYDDLRKWLRRAAQYPVQPIIRKRHLALVVSNQLHPKCAVRSK